MTHDLKTWPEYFKAVREGKKKFELRKNDRDFKVGDQAVLWEYEPETAKLTGQIFITEITYILDSGPWLQPGYVAFGFESELDYQAKEAQQQAVEAARREAR